MYGGVGQFAKWTQTVALLEVVHALFGEWISDCWRGFRRVCFGELMFCGEEWRGGCSWI